MVPTEARISRDAKHASLAASEEKLQSKMKEINDHIKSTSQILLQQNSRLWELVDSCKEELIHCSKLLQDLFSLNNELYGPHFEDVYRRVKDMTRSPLFLKLGEALYGAFELQNQVSGH
jgi:predicted transcriptional regulator